jgi:hypothetical protein
MKNGKEENKRLRNFIFLFIPVIFIAIISVLVFALPLNESSVTTNKMEIPIQTTVIPSKIESSTVSGAPSTSCKPIYYLEKNSTHILTELINFLNISLTQEEFTQASLAIETNVIPKYVNGVCNVSSLLLDIESSTGISIDKALIEKKINEIKEIETKMPLINDTIANEADLIQQELSYTTTIVPDETAPYLGGSSYVLLVFVQGPGESWSSSDKNSAWNYVVDATSWMKSVGPSNANLSFGMGYYVANVSVKPKEGAGYIWMEEAAKNIGYSDLDNDGKYTDDMIYSLKTWAGKDNGIIIFIPHEDGRSYAYVSGVPRTTVYFYNFCFLFLCFQEDYPVYVHESLHLFGADDEYYQPWDGTGCDVNACTEPVWFAYPHLQNYYTNENCEHCNSNSVDSVMKDHTVIKAKPNAISYGAKCNLGWCDYDSDGILDPKDPCISTYGNECENCCNGIDDDNDGFEDGYDSSCQQNVSLTSDANSICWGTPWNYYSNNLDFYSGSFVCPSDTGSMTIDSYIDTEQNFDFFYVYSQNGTMLGNWSGFLGNITIGPFQESALRFRFKSDFIQVGTGVRIYKINCISSCSQSTSTCSNTQGTMSCEQTLRGCLRSLNQKFYTISGTKNKDVIINITNMTGSCIVNTLDIFDSACLLQHTIIGTGSWMYDDVTTDSIKIGVNSYVNSACDWTVNVVCREANDTTPPLINIISPLNQTYNRTSVLFNVSTNERVNSIEYQLDNSSISTMCKDCDSASFNLFSLTGGSHKITAFATDYSNNKNSTSVIFTIDTSKRILIECFGVTSHLCSSYNSVDKIDSITLDELTIPPGDKINFIVNWTGWHWGDENHWAFFIDNSSTPIATCKTFLSDSQGTLYTFRYNITLPSNISLSNHTLQITANDNGGYCNLGETGMDSEKSASFVVKDKTIPVWSNNITSPSSPVTYIKGTGYQFNITWIDEFGIDDVVFEFDGNNYSYSRGQLSKYGNIYQKILTDLPAGIYNFRWYANDTSNNWNTTELQVFTIDKTVPSISISPLTSVNYGTTTRTGCQKINSDSGSTLTLYRNGTQVANGTSNVINESSIVLAAGTYNYTCTISATQNYTATTLTDNYRTVNQNTTNPINIYFMYSANTYKNQNVTITYGQQTTANATVIYSNSGTADLYEDELLSSNPRTTTLSAGIHAYKGNTSGNENYAANSTGATYYIIVNKISPSLSLTGLNVTYPSAVNVQASESNVDDSDCVYTLYRNSTIVGSGSSVLDTTQLPAGRYVYVYNTSGCTNYATNSVSLGINISKAISSCSVFPPTQTITYGASVTQYCTSDYGGCELYRNGTDITIENNTTVVYGAGQVNFIGNLSASQNYSSCFASSTLTINPQITTIYLTLDGNETNLTYEYPATINATGWKQVDEGIIKLYRNGTEINNSDIFSPTELSLWNYTLVYLQANNYTALPITRFARTQDTTPPALLNAIISPKIAKQNSNVTLTTTITDNYMINYAYATGYNSSWYPIFQSKNLTKIGYNWYLILNTSNASTGIHYFNVTAIDVSGNNRTTWIDNVTINQTSGAIDTFTNKSVSTTMNVATLINMTQTMNTTLEIVTNQNISDAVASMSIYIENPETTNFGVISLNKYVEVVVSPEVNNSLSWAIIKVYYTDAEVSNAGIDESTLRLYYFDGLSWIPFNPPTGGVNTVDNYVWANTTHFSIFGIYGNAPTPPATTTTPTGGTTGGTTGTTGTIGTTGKTETTPTTTTTTTPPATTTTTTPLPITTTTNPIPTARPSPISGFFVFATSPIVTAAIFSLLVIVIIVLIMYWKKLFIFKRAAQQ